MNCVKSGWYNEDGELVASDRGELMEFLDCEGELLSRLVEYVEQNYDFSDFIESMIEYESFYATPDEIREEYAENEIIEGEDFELCGCEPLYWHEEGDEIDGEEDEEDEEDEDEEDE